MRNGEEVKFSKRSGSIVTLEELLADVGSDAVRYFFAMRKAESELVFDIDLARAQSEESTGPVPQPLFMKFRLAHKEQT